MRSSDVTLAICRFLGDTGKAVYRETGTYLATDKAVVVKHFPTAPDAAVAVTVYDTGDAIGVERREIMFQLRFRSGGSRTAVDDFADDIKAHLHDRYNFDLGGIRVRRCRRVNFSPLGPEANKREERVDNYAMFVTA